MGWASTIVLYLLGLVMAWDYYHAAAAVEPDFEPDEPANKLAIAVTCLLWPVVELYSLFVRGETQHGE